MRRSTNFEPQKWWWFARSQSTKRPGKQSFEAVIETKCDSKLARKRPCARRSLGWFPGDSCHSIWGKSLLKAENNIKWLLWGFPRRPCWERSTIVPSQPCGTWPSVAHVTALSSRSFARCFRSSKCAAVGGLAEKRALELSTEVLQNELASSFSGKQRRH